MKVIGIATAGRAERYVAEQAGLRSFAVYAQRAPKRLPSGNDDWLPRIERVGTVSAACGAEAIEKARKQYGLLAPVVGREDA